MSTETTSTTQGGVDTYTDAERQVIESDAAEAKAAEQAAQTPKPEAEAPAAQVVTDPPKEAPPAEIQQPAVPVIAAPAMPVIAVDPALAARDFDAEQAALQAKWDEGELSQAEYNKAFAEIVRAQTLRDTQASFAQQFAAQAQAAQAQTFEQQAAAFLQLPENRDILDPTRYRLFQAVLKHVDEATGLKLDNAALLLETHKQFRAVIPAPPPVPAAPPQRGPDASTIPPRIANAPAAATPRTQHHDVEQLAAMPIEDTERALMGMSSEQIEQLLARTPGSETVWDPKAAA